MIKIGTEKGIKSRKKMLVQHLMEHNKASEWSYKLLGNYVKDAVPLEDPPNHQVKHEPETNGEDFGQNNQNKSPNFPQGCNPTAQHL